MDFCLQQGEDLAEGMRRLVKGQLEEAISHLESGEYNSDNLYSVTTTERFVAMDLDRLGRPELSNRFLNSYLEASGDWEALPLLDFYRAYRAWVRGKVLGFQLAAHPGLAGRGRALFELAAGYARQRPPARLLITTGVMGAGKSTVARALAARLGAVVIRTDAVRKRLAGVPLHARAAHGFGEGLYTGEMGRRTYDEALRLAAELLAAGLVVIVDGSFSTRAERDRARAVAWRLGVPFTALWCDAPEAVIRLRLRAREGDRHEVSDGREELLAAHRARYEPPTDEPEAVRLEMTDGEADLVRVIAAAAGEGNP